MYSSQLPATGFTSPVLTPDLAIEKLTEAINKMLIQLQDRRSSNSENFSRVICYKCGKARHISQNCHTPVSFNLASSNILQNYIPGEQAYHPGQPFVPTTYPYPSMVPQNLAAPNGPSIVNNGNTSMPIPESIGTQIQDVLQALLAIAANLNSFGTQHNAQNSSETQNNIVYNQPTYINIPVEDMLLFAVGSCDDPPGSTTR